LQEEVEKVKQLEGEVGVLERLVEEGRCLLVVEGIHSEGAVK
jgi:hypothetical protein